MRSIFFGALILMASPALADAPPGGVPLIDPITRQAKVMGKPFIIRQQAVTVPSGQGINTSTHSQFLGHSGTLIDASVQAIPTAPTENSVNAHVLTSGAVGTNDSTVGGATASPTPAGLELGRTDLYIEGVRIWTGSLRYQNGALVYSGGVPPTQLPFTVFVYPVGPLTLQVDAGVEFEGEVDASLMAGLSYPLTDSELNAKLSANIGAGGFIEGYANLWLIRAGVGGAVDLIEGTTGVEGHIYMNGRAPSGKGFGMIHLLSGDLYGYFDTRFLFGRWTRIYKKEFYRWGGWCYSFGATSCGIQ